MASALANRARLACNSQVRHISLGQRGWLGKFFEKPQAQKQTPDPEIPIQKAAAVSPLATADDASTPKIIKSTKRKPLSPDSKSLRLQQNIEFMTQRLQRPPNPRISRIAKTTWIRTLGVCQTEEDLRKVMELFPLWKAMNQRFDGKFSEAFICRCIMLKKPEIAIEALGNYAKFNVPLTMAGARKLLQATYETQPLVVPITISSFFRTYGLPPVEKDLPCCAMLLAACLKDGSKKATTIARKLATNLKYILTKADPQPIPQTQEKGDDMPRVWTSWALRKIEETLPKRTGYDVEWLHSWRLKSGHVASAS